MAETTPSTKGGKASNLARHRNIGIVAHIDSGKTTVSEQILSTTGRIHKIGNVDMGDTTLDYLPEERERGITITSAATTCYWGNYLISLIDTPGHVDFTIEVERSLRVLDGAVGVFCGVAGVQAQSQTVWRQASRYNVPRIIFVNKLDRMGADFAKAVDSIVKKLRAHVVVIQYPIGMGTTLKGVYDILSNRAWGFEGVELTDWKPNAEDAAAIAVVREKMVEALADADDQMADAFLAGKTPSDDEIKAALRRATIARKIHPVCCGSALKGVAIEPLLDAVCAYLPSPLDIGDVQGVHPVTGEPEIRRSLETDPLACLSFKTISEPTGDLTFIRVYSGVLKPGENLYNPRTKHIERIGRLYRMHADKREAIEKAGPGEIAACIGLREAGTGDTLCDPSKPVRLPGTVLPNGVIAIAVSPPNAADRDKFGEALRRLTREDPTLRILSNPETNETLLEGMGELHLEIATNRLTRDFKIELIQGKPQVAYRTTVKHKAEIHIRHIKQTGGHGQYAVIKLDVEPIQGASELVFENETTGGNIPQEFVPPIEKGIREEAEKGAGQKYPLVALKFTLTDGRHHDVDSSDMAFRIAGQMAARESLVVGGSQLLEPIMSLEVVVPDDFVGPVTGDISRRRGIILSQEPGEREVVVRAEVPAAEMFAYATSLRSATKGLGAFTLEPLEYRAAPAAIAAKIREDDEKREKEKKR